MLLNQSANMNGVIHLSTVLVFLLSIITSYINTVNGLSSTSERGTFSFFLNICFILIIKTFLLYYQEPICLAN